MEIDVVVIRRGMTNQLQPFDVSIKKSFNDWIITL